MKLIQNPEKKYSPAYKIVFYYVLPHIFVYKKHNNIKNGFTVAGRFQEPTKIFNTRFYRREAVCI